MPDSTATTTENTPDLATPAAVRPGLRSGNASELTLIAPLLPGGGAKLRELLAHPRVPLATAADRVGTLHDMRWVIFDNDTRVLFCTTYDGDWDAYINDFATLLPEALDTYFAVVDGYPGITSPEIKDWIVAHQITAAGWYSAYPDATVRSIWKGQKVLTAFESLLDAASG